MQELNKDQKKSFKILCIDDETAILDLTERFVEELGFTPLEAHSGEEAIDVIKNNAKDIIFVISDLKLPDFDGLEIRRRMLTEFKDIPFAIISAFITKELALQGIQQKICGFIEKPFKEEEVEALIKKESKDRINTILEEREILQGFLEEADGILEEMESLILSLESNPDDLDCINRIFALAHTIKGSSGFFKPDTVHRFTHRFEDELSKLKTGEQAVTPPIVEILLKSWDTLRTLIQNLREGTPPSQSLEELTKIFTAQKTDEQPKATAIPSDKPTSSAPKTPSTQPAQSQEIRVDIQLLDEFMELSGEITVIRNMINKLVRSIENAYPGNKDISLLSELLDEMYKINATLQSKVGDLRKVPLKSVFRAVPRTVRDLASAMKKQVKLDIIGEKIRVDTSIAEALNKCIIHMIRNCIDHGLESPDDRKAIGKAPEGKVTIRCHEEKEDTIIEISDDGKGLSVEKIQAKALKEGIYTHEDIKTLSNSQLFQAIFHSGFSTAQKVTDVSGRGVGMDMVRTSVEKVGGKIEIDSKEGEGTRFIIVLPVPKSVLIVDSLLVEVGEMSFGIPQDNIIRLLSYGKNELPKMVQSLEFSQFIKLDGRLIPIIFLSRALKIKGAVKKMSEIYENNEIESLNIVVLQSKKGVFGVIVDSICDTEDTVVKELNENLRKNRVFGGATFLGDGRVGLIIDVDGLADLLKIKLIGNKLLESQTAEKETPRKIEEPENKPDREHQGILTFSLPILGRFGAPLNQVYRLEVFDRKDVQLSGRQPTVIYRNQVMPLISVPRILNLKSKTDLLEMNRLPTLILNDGDHYMGLVVKSIMDIIDYDEKLDFEIKNIDGILGNTIINDYTMSILDIPRILEKATLSVSKHSKPAFPDAKIS